MATTSAAEGVAPRAASSVSPAVGMLVCAPAWRRRGCRRRRALHRVGERQAAVARGGERADEGVAGGGGVDRGHFRRRRERALAGDEADRARRPQGDDDGEAEPRANAAPIPSGSLASIASARPSVAASCSLTQNSRARRATPRSGRGRSEISITCAPRFLASSAAASTSASGTSRCSSNRSPGPKGKPELLGPRRGVCAGGDDKRILPDGRRR